MAVSVIGLGAGGHAKVMIEILRAAGGFHIVGLLDSNLKAKGEAVLGVTILGDDSVLPDFVMNGVAHFFLGVGSVGDSTIRRRIYEMAVAQGMQAVRAIHPWSVVSSSAEFGAGITVMAGAIINACSIIGVNVIVNTGAIIEHDCIIGDHSHVATGARLAGAVRVGRMSHIGAGATVRQGIEIGENAVIGAGAVVVKNVTSGSIVAGVPATPISRQTDIGPDTGGRQRRSTA
jgi:sugar O-acyltransferase (sialic acid O-acetyltransferase NeuD family)